MWFSTPIVPQPEDTWQTPASHNLRSAVDDGFWDTFGLSALVSRPHQRKNGENA